MLKGIIFTGVCFWFLVTCFDARDQDWWQACDSSKELVALSVALGTFFGITLLFDFGMQWRLICWQWEKFREVSSRIITEFDQRARIFFFPSVASVAQDSEVYRCPVCSEDVKGEVDVAEGRCQRHYFNYKVVMHSRCSIEFRTSRF
jgi:hypothetical protein